MLLFCSESMVSNIFVIVFCMPNRYDSLYRGMCIGTTFMAVAFSASKSYKPVSDAYRYGCIDFASKIIGIL